MHSWISVGRLSNFIEGAGSGRSGSGAGRRGRAGHDRSRFAVAPSGTHSRGIPPELFLGSGWGKGVLLGRVGSTISGFLTGSWGGVDGGPDGPGEPGLKEG